MRKTILLFLIEPIIQASYRQAALKPDFDIGVQLLQSKRYKQAAETFSVILNKADNDKLKKYCYIYRALSYGGTGDFPFVITDLDKAIKPDPNDLASYTDGGKTMIYANDMNGAQMDFLFILSTDSIGDQGKGGLLIPGKDSIQVW